jgi:CRISPR-associated Csx14 family protein
MTQGGLHTNLLDPQTAVLIATLGSEPQVVTAAYDLLARQGERVGAIWVVHTSPQASSPVGVALAALQDLADTEFHAICGAEGGPLADVDSPEAGAAAFRLLYRLVRRAKQAGRRVHLSIAGGRKTMAVYGMATAQLLFDSEDRLWHLFSAGEFLTSRRPHPQPGDQAHLIPVPVILWSQVSPVWSGLGGVEDPFEAARRVQELQVAQKLAAAREFVLGSLSPAELRAVELLVREGLGDQEIGARLSLSARTVEQHLRSAYSKAAAHWEIETVSRAQLVALLNLYFATKLRENPQDKGERLR